MSEPRAWIAWGVLCLAPAWPVLCSGLEPSATTKANAWVGRDASELLLQLRVDGGRVQIGEVDALMVTRFTWRTVTPAWTERVHVSGGELIGVTIQNNVHLPHYTPIVYDEVDHPEKHRCDVTYVADREGVVRRWEHQGPHCSDDIVGPNASGTRRRS